MTHRSSWSPVIRSGAILFILLIFSIACNNPVKSPEAEEGSSAGYVFQVPAWSKNAVIYEVNIRQYTPEGTFKAFESHLPRLKELGVDILWLMPIFPIGELNRKGTLGSYYAVKDYKKVNPEFGTLEDFKSLVSNAHEMGFHVILDWVANHTAWDNPWIFDHPDWYTHDSTGKIIYPSDWTDVADLNYDNEDMRNAMIDALRYWVKEADVDGYRCDVAADVPTDFWDRARFELDQVKPVFMLAEAEKADHHDKAFDMSYAWELHGLFNKIAKGEKNADDLEEYFIKHDTVFPASAYRMTFITNHDENSWNGTVKERLGDGGQVFAVLSYTLPGMPLIYSGQEAGLDKRLAFFEKDQIDWYPESPLMAFYTALNRMKKDNEALWNGQYGGIMKRVETSGAEKVYAFTRVKDDNELLIVANLSAESIDVGLGGGWQSGAYSDFFSGETQELTEGATLKLGPWDYRIFIRGIK